MSDTLSEKRIPMLAGTKAFVGNNSSLVAFLAMCVVFSIFVPKFFNLSNLFNVLDLVSLPMITASAMAFAILLGGIDLSLEGISGLACVFVSILVKNMTTQWQIGLWVIPIALAVGLLCGLLNGILHTYIKIPSFMITFCMGSIMTGIGIMITQGISVIVQDDSIRILALGRLWGIPYSFLIAVAAVFFLNVIHKRTPFGRHVTMIGGDEQVMMDLGVNVRWTKIFVFGVAGMIWGLVGVLLVAKLGTGHPYNSQGMNFEAIGACLIGGIAVTGGIGDVGKAVCGAFIMIVLRNAMILLSINPYVQDGFVGIVTIAIVALTIDRDKIKILK